LSLDTGTVALMTAAFSALTADSAPPISAPNLICTSSATGHLKCKAGRQRPANPPHLVMAGLDPAISLKLHQIPGPSPGKTNWGYSNLMDPALA
jgi:hypothetical protein